MRDFLEGILLENIEGAMPIYLYSPRLCGSYCCWAYSFSKGFAYCD